MKEEIVKTMNVQLHLSKGDVIHPTQLAGLLQALADRVASWDDLDTGIMQVHRGEGKFATVSVVNLTKPTWEVMIGDSEYILYKGSDESRARMLFNTSRFTVPHSYLLKNESIVDEHHEERTPTY